MDRGKVEATAIPSIDHFIGGWLATVSRKMTREEVEEGSSRLPRPALRCSCWREWR